MGSDKKKHGKNKTRFGKDRMDPSLCFQTDVHVNFLFPLKPNNFKNICIL
jgi:hypothetical protein